MLVCSVPNNEAACLTSGGQWLSQPSHGLPAPACLPSEAAASYAEDQGNFLNFTKNIILLAK